MKKTLNIGGRILDLSEPKIMGIINLTPDSFYSKSRSLEDYRSKMEKMILEGVDILDLGAYSTRPGASEISVQEEVDRLLPALEYIKDSHPNLNVSIDTFRSKVASEVLKLGKYIINDVSGGSLDEDMWNVVSKNKVPYILMHMRGNPDTMQSIGNLSYEDITLDVYQSLQERVKLLLAKGVSDIIIDPGIGFAKSIEGNFELLKNLSFFTSMDFPLLVGVSRKSFIYKSLGIDAENALNGTTALHVLSLLSGAQVLRVHDVASAVEVKHLLKLLDFAKS
ncbi:dihydropteroate synthase [Spirosomataceae bacterium TFI 002]|nr:dihydropteroate synthase [Spirosomataceae bacterium TFI 002]